MKKYIIRLDDASEFMNFDKWMRVISILDKMEIKAIIGVIPCAKDPEMLVGNRTISNFWEIVQSWSNKSHILAMHGVNHLYNTKDGGINPVHNRSEFAGLTYEVQSNLIKSGWNVFVEKHVIPEVFFAPSHTFDNNTLLALINNTSIRIVSDTIANNIYFHNGIYFIPQQFGKFRKSFFKLTTFCFHPNYMHESDFSAFEEFIIKNKKYFSKLDLYDFRKRSLNLGDLFFRFAYFSIRKIKKIKYNKESIN